MRDLNTLSWPALSFLLIFLIILCAAPTFGEQSGALVVTSLREVYRTQTNFDVPIGGAADNYVFTVWCDPNVAVETTVTIVNQNSAFSPTPNSPVVSHIFCGSYYYVIFRFTPAEPGLVTDVVTVSSEIGSASLQLIGNGIPVESPPFWIADLPTGTSAERLLYDALRGYLYVTDSNNNRLIVFSPSSRSLVATIPVGYAPFGMALTPDGKFLYVANAGEYSISEIDLYSLQESRRIILPSLGPYPGYTPYALAVIGEGLLLIGSYPPGLASGGPIFELDLNNQTLSPRNDIGSGMFPDFATSSDFSTTAILVEPYASPTDFVRYDHATGSITKANGGIEAGVSINQDGTEIVSNDAVCTNSFLPDLHLMDSQLNTISGIGLLGCKALQTAFSADGTKVYAVSDDGSYSQITGTVIHEVDLSALRQTRALQFGMPNGYYPLPHTKAMAVSDDGLWIYSIFGQTGNAPPSKLLAMKVGHVDGVSSLAVAKVGTGTGTVTSSPGGIDCGTDCSETYQQATVVTLTATALSGSAFGSWSGCDSVSGNACTVTMNADKTVTATFTDITAPESPAGLGANPSGWTNTNSFTLSWSNPGDPSGIAAAWYKVGSVPTSATDGTRIAGSNIQSLPGVLATAQGGQSVYVWLEDGAGNKDHNNRGSTTLFYDATAPAAVSNLAAPSSTTNSVILTWSNPADSGSGNASFDVRYRVGSTFVEADWATASLATGEPLPPTTGMTVGSLICNTTYAFALKTVDGAGNSSLISNAATRGTAACDTTPPDTSITSGPTGTIATNSATFSWTGTDNVTPVAGLVYAYRLNPLEVNYSAFGSAVTKSYSNLANGTYTMLVKAKDQAGNEDPSPATRAFTVSTGPALSVSPTSVAPGGTVTATWSGIPSPSPTDWIGIYSPGADNTSYIQPNWIYVSCSQQLGSARASGSCSFPLSVGAGTYELRLLANDGFTWLATSNPITVAVVDTTAPDTSITSGPTGTIATNSATFSWTGTDNVTPVAGLVYAYRLNPLEVNYSAFGGGTTKSYSNLANGTYTMLVKAKDQAGNEDPTPASRTFTVNVGVDTTPPDTNITASPPSISNSTSASFSFTSTEAGSTFECKLDAGAFVSCASPTSYTNLAVGGHNFQVRATDLAANTDPTPASYSWTIDTSAPDTSITSGPTGTIATNSATFSWTGTDNVTAVASLIYAYRLDPLELNYSAFGSAATKSYSGLANGTYTMLVKAKDQAGNEDPTPASRAFTVNVQGVNISASPASVAVGGTVTASWSGISNPSSTDWIGLYTPGAADTAYIAWIYVSCTQEAGGASASGSCPFGLPVGVGTYELRLLANDGFSRLATSNPVTVGP